MLTTVVGSYPARTYSASSFKDKLSDFLGNYDTYLLAIENAVKSQLEAGVNIISDGQVRGEMIKIFARAVQGMVWEDGTSKIKTKIGNINYSTSSNDLKTALKIAKKYSKDYNNQPLMLNGEFQENVRGVKGIITGPTTMVLSSRLEGFYTREKRKLAVLDMARALKREAELLESAGAAVIQIDEPFLSTGIADLKIAYKAIKIMGSDLKVPLAMHVCGDLRNVLPDLVKFPVSILDCEFAGNKTNLPLLETQELKGKKIGFGCVDTKTERVESTEEIVKLLKKGKELIGEKNMIIDPDCGMRNLKEEAALNKLKNMTEAVRWLS